MGVLRNHWQLLLTTALVFALWRTPAVIPLKLFVVVLHELSHGLAALATGGAVEQISVDLRQGGYAITRGGSRFLILSAGYLGSLLLGAALLVLALRTRADRAATACVGALLLVVAALYVRDLFAVAFCVGTGAALLAAARFLHREINDFLLRVIGLASLIYVPYDIFSDTIARASLRSDARMLAEEFGGPTMLWGALWLLVSAAVIVLCVRYAVGETTNADLSPRRARRDGAPPRS